MKYDFWLELDKSKEIKKKRKCLGNSLGCRKLVLGIPELRLCTVCKTNTAYTSNHVSTQFFETHLKRSLLRNTK